MTLLKVSNQSFSATTNLKTQQSHKTLIMNNIRTFRKLQRKKNPNNKRNPKLTSLKNGKKKLSPFWRKETSINSQPSTIETWPSFSFVCFQNTWNPMLIKKFSLPKPWKKFKRSWIKNASAWKILKFYSVESAQEWAENFCPEFWELV